MEEGWLPFNLVAGFMIFRSAPSLEVAALAVVGFNFAALVPEVTSAALELGVVFEALAMGVAFAALAVGVTFAALAVGFAFAPLVLGLTFPLTERALDLVTLKTFDWEL